MFPRAIALAHLMVAVFFCTSLLAQEKPPASAPAVQEYPVLLQQSLTAGKTPVGAKILAKLTVATLVDGTVIPRNAVFSGEVTESVAKSPTTPSRLGIRMDSVQWKSGSAVVKVYLTPWFYPAIDEKGQDLQYGPTEPASRTWNGQGQYPDSSKSYKPFPGSDSAKGAAVPDTPSSATSNHRVLMRDVESTSGTDGGMVVTCKHANVKLDKATTYVLAAGDLMPVK